MMGAASTRGQTMMAGVESAITSSRCLLLNLLLPLVTLQASQLQIREHCVDGVLELDERRTSLLLKRHPDR